MRNSMKLIIPLAILIIGAGVLFAVKFRSEKKPEVRNIEVSFDSDVAKPRRLVNAVDNIFVGKVRRQVKTHYIGGSVVPSTLFRVEVRQNIKGSLPKIVQVNQDGGYSEEENAFLLVLGDSMLEPGEVYLFATKVGGNGKWHTLVPIYGDVRIDNEAKRVELVEMFEKIVAKEQQVPPES